MTKAVLIAGATGMMGRKIAEAALVRGGATRLMVRGGEDHPKADSLRPMLARGAEIVDADVARPETLVAAVRGVGVIVSALQGGPDVIIKGQRALAEAGKAAGVRRIFPSDFSVDFRELAPEEHVWLAIRKQGDIAIAEVGLPQTNTFNGAFSEMLMEPFLGLIDWDRDAVAYWGDADQDYDFTTTDDTAAYVAAAALDDDAPEGAFEIVGDVASPRKLAQIVTQVTRRTFSLDRLGDLVELDAEIARRQAAAPDDPFQWAGLQYSRAMANGRGKIHGRMNARYPEIVPEGVAGFLTRALTARGGG